LPYIIYETAEGNYSAAADFAMGVLPDDALSDEFTEEVGGVGLGDVLGSILDALVGGDEDIYDSEGAYYSVECHEEIPFNSPQAADAAAQTIPPEIRDGMTEDVATLFETCAIWGAGEADSIENEPVRSDIPTLVMAGQFDPITPPQWGRETVPYLPYSSFFEYPGLGHAVIDGGDCPVAMMMAFLNDPGTPPDASCMAQMGGPAYYIR
jgi:pimeloyl-ACP methyl ester carboxylesterase